MESSIKSLQRWDEKVTKILEQRLRSEDWKEIFTCVLDEAEIETTARETKALQRKREIRSGTDLLRLVLAYTVCDWSLRTVGMWSGMMGLGNLSDVAVLKRLRNCQGWLGRLIVRILEKRQRMLGSKVGVRLRIMDGTGVGRPGSKGPDWRVHLSLNLGQLCIDGLEITDVKGGESFGRCPTQAGEIRMGDRGYAFPVSLGAVLANGGQLVVRINWQSVPLQTLEGHKIDLGSHLRQMTGKLSHQEVRYHTPQGYFSLRLIVGALPELAAEKARLRLSRWYRKKSKTPDERTLLAAGFVMLLTNLPATEWPADEILYLYRLRWQIELLIKRLKTIVHLDHLRALEAPLAQVYLLGKLLAILLIDELISQTQLRCPSWFIELKRPANIWRLTVLFFEHLRQMVQGHLPLEAILEMIPKQKRFLCNSPRKRLHQLSQACIFLQSHPIMAGSASRTL
jgi:hypothetical protein